jgi:hypothetical protein
MMLASIMSAQLLPEFIEADDDSTIDTPYLIRGRLLPLLQEYPSFSDELINKILISPKKKMANLFIDEVNELIREIKSSFPKAIRLESIGKSYEGRDIWMIKLDAHRHLERMSLSTNTQDLEERKAILLTGAHHAREGVSV